MSRRECGEAAEDSEGSSAKGVWPVDRDDDANSPTAPPLLPAPAFQSITTESLPHHASASGGVAACVANSDRVLLKSELQTTSLASPSAAATNPPQGETAIAATAAPIEALVLEPPERASQTTMSRPEAVMARAEPVGEAAGGMTASGGAVVVVKRGGGREDGEEEEGPAACAELASTSGLGSGSTLGSANPSSATSTPRLVIATSPSPQKATAATPSLAASAPSVRTRAAVGVGEARDPPPLPSKKASSGKTCASPVVAPTTTRSSSSDQAIPATMPPVQGNDDDDDDDDEDEPPAVVEEEVSLLPRNCPAADATRIAGACTSPGRSLTGLRSSRRRATGPP